MNENVGASFGLSLLIVGFFAVVLYQPEPPLPHVAAVPPAAPIEPVEAHPPEVPPAPAAVAKPMARAGPVARPISRRQARKAEPVEPRGAFTRVRAGETLADVARRVYGPDGDLKALWLANRDLLDRPDDPLSPDSILRTP